MSRLPIRIRLTLPFAVAMAAVLAALGGFVYLRVGATLLRSADQTLYAQATESALRLDKGRGPLDLDSTEGVPIAQVVALDGKLVTSAPASLAPLLDARRARSWRSGSSVRASVLIPGRTGRWRLLAGSRRTQAAPTGLSCSPPPSMPGRVARASAPRAPRRLTARAAPRDPGRVPARGCCASSGRGDAAQGGGDLGDDAGRSSAGAAARATRCHGSPRR